MRSILAITIVALFDGAVGNAQTATNLIVTPSSAIFDCKNIAGVPMDAAPGFPFGSFQSTGGPATLCGSGGSSYKTDMYFTPESLFGGRSVKIGDIASISYWTKNATTHIVDPRDWYLVIYTKKYPSQLSGWYGARIGTEPYSSENLTDPPNKWARWTTGGPVNQLRFFESTYGYFGSYSDPHWAAFIAGNSLGGGHGPSVPYANQPILSFSVQTASTWAAGFTGKLDGLRIQLTDLSVATINFEPFLVATDKEACKDNGWMNLHRADGGTFKNQGDCIAYVNAGKESQTEESDEGDK